MAKPTVTGLELRLGRFLGESHPTSVNAGLQALSQVLRSMEDPAGDPDRFEAVRDRFRRELGKRLKRSADRLPEDLGDPIPGRRIHRIADAQREVILEDCDGFLRREAIAASLTSEERREILRGMIYTRAVDNRLKQFFLGSEVRYEGQPFQGKGFRSLGQEAIFAAPVRLRRGPECRGPGGTWKGDVVAPMIRDLGAALAMALDDDALRQVLNAQMGKSGPPMNGKDFHLGDFSRGVLPPTAPLSLSTLIVSGLALAFKMNRSRQVAVSFIGEGGTSLGEWHESINSCAVRRLPAVFCVENNQTALSTPVREQTAAIRFAEKARGYGIPGITLDGTDPDAVAAGFTWAAERARAGDGPALIELVCMRMCGHAHHDDMLYLGKEPPVGWDYPAPGKQGYVDRELYAAWTRKDPIRCYERRLLEEGILEKGEGDRLRKEAEDAVARQAKIVIEAEWPSPSEAGSGVLAGEPPRVRIEPLEDRTPAPVPPPGPAPSIEPAPPFDTKGTTFLEAVMLGIGDALEADPAVFLYGEDIGGKYGNAFLLLRPLLEKYGERILNSPLAEGGILGVCIGAALAGKRPIGEIQFNDFIATGFNPLVNGAAKIRYRWGRSVPMVLRLPWGGMRHAGPYHSQNTEPWFYRTPGLKIVAPSTPHDARRLMLASVQDPDPVLFYEHIALYRDPKIRQDLSGPPEESVPIGKAAVRRTGDDLLIISYGAYVHLCLRAAERLSRDGVESAVLDLRTLAPLDRATVLSLARRCGKVLIVHEDTRTGGIGESLAAFLQEEAFENLDAPIRILGALDTPVPYAPPLEAAFLPSEAEIENAARLLAGY